MARTAYLFDYQLHELGILWGIVQEKRPPGPFDLVCEVPSARCTLFWQHSKIHYHGRKREPKDTRHNVCKHCPDGHGVEAWSE